MPAYRVGRFPAGSGRVAALCSGLALTAASSCTFPGYQTAAQNDDGGSSTAATAGTSNNGGNGATTTSGGKAGASVTAGSGGTRVDSGGQGGAPDVIGASGAAGAEPIAGAGGTSNSGILFFDDFESGNDDLWFATSGDWKVVSDGSSQVYQLANLFDMSLFSVAGDLEWTDMVVEAKVKVLEWGGSNSSDLVAVYARFESPAKHYYVALRGDGKFAIRKKIDTNVTLGTPVDLALEKDVQYRVRFELVGSELKAYLNDVLQVTATDSEITAGRIAIGADFGRAEFDDVKVSLPP